jgi:isopentenyl-diphosphate delta-isomerase
MDEMSSEHRIVSSEAEELILVDAEDNETGFLSKADCHNGSGHLHRAFSLFLFNEQGELLLQQRSASKRLWPGFWSNSICSHPRRGESMQVATQRRLQDELNFDTELEYVYKFSYQADFGDAGAENEFCHVFLGRVADTLKPNEHEISAVRFVAPDVLAQEFVDSAETFTPWFKMEWQSLTNDYREKLAAYCQA